mmetsp:Transcript_38725/g.66981  ORF Transcript_38725/g.66981 Transcript_38725/m.66981 type:complete len:255 (+) Transcript_38725:85-849(+)
MRLEVPNLVDDVQGALEEVAHLPVGLALASHILSLLHQIRHHLLLVELGDELILHGVLERHHQKVHASLGHQVHEIFLDDVEVGTNQRFDDLCLHSFFVTGVGGAPHFVGDLRQTNDTEVSRLRVIQLVALLATAATARTSLGAGGLEEPKETVVAIAGGVNRRRTRGGIHERRIVGDTVGSVATAVRRVRVVVRALITTGRTRATTGRGAREAATGGSLVQLAALLGRRHGSLATDKVRMRGVDISQLDRDEV